VHLLNRLKISDSWVFILAFLISLEMNHGCSKDGYTSNYSKLFIAFVVLLKIDSPNDREAAAAPPLAWTPKY